MKSIYCIIASILLHSCGDNYKNDLSESKKTFVSEFPVVLQIDAERISIETTGLNNIFIIDNYLIGINYSGSNNFLHVYDNIRFSKLGSLISRGKGPDELLTLQYNQQWEKDSAGTYMWVTDINSNKLCRLNIGKSIDLKNSVYDRCIDNIEMFNSFNIFYMDDNYILTNPRISRHNKHNTLQLFNYNTSKLDNEYQLYSDDFSSNIDERIYQLFCTVKPDRTKISAFSMRFSRIHIFNRDHTDSRTITVFQDVTEGIISNSLRNKELHDINRFYNSLTVTEEFIFALYVNKHIEELMSSEAIEGAEIHIFDWNGNPIKQLLIAENIWQITIDDKEKHLYGITANEEVYRYNLSNIY